MIFCIGDLDAVLANTEQTPFITIFYNSTKSKAATVLRASCPAFLFMSLQIYTNENEDSDNSHSACFRRRTCFPSRHSQPPAVVFLPRRWSAWQCLLASGT
jgi:hypothetical protein